MVQTQYHHIITILSPTHIKLWSMTLLIQMTLWYYYSKLESVFLIGFLVYCLHVLLSLTLTLDRC